MRELSLYIDGALDGRRVSRLAMGPLSMSYSLFKAVKYRGEMLLDGHAVRANAVAREGQTLVLRLPDDSGPPVAPYAIELVIPYEDDDLLIIDKSAPLPSVRSRTEDSLTLENAVYSHLGCPEGFVYHPVNRLDKGTSGLMAVALHPHAQKLMQDMLHTDRFLRQYLAVLEGVPLHAEGVIDAPIAKLSGPGIRREVRTGGREAVTRYRVLRVSGGRSLVELTLETGRTHQIRVHMAHIGCPVAGDFLYGGELPDLPGRFALHSHRLRLAHPMTGKPLCITSPLPPELSRLI